MLLTAFLKKKPNIFLNVFFTVKRGKLPPVLYLQLDNCYRDCKNIHILGFCALLLKAGVFKKVLNCFLISSVPYSHELSYKPVNWIFRKSPPSCSFIFLGSIIVSDGWTHSWRYWSGLPSNFFSFSFLINIQNDCVFLPCKKNKDEKVKACSWCFFRWPCLFSTEMIEGQTST